MEKPPRNSHSYSPEYPADRVRQGEIILRTRTRRVVFVAGLVGVVLLALVAAIIPLMHG